MNTRGLIRQKRNKIVQRGKMILLVRRFPAFNSGLNYFVENIPKNFYISIILKCLQSSRTNFLPNLSLEQQPSRRILVPICSHISKNLIHVKFIKFDLFTCSNLKIFCQSTIPTSLHIQGTSKGPFCSQPLPNCNKHRYADPEPYLTTKISGFSKEMKFP